MHLMAERNVAVANAAFLKESDRVQCALAALHDEKSKAALEQFARDVGLSAADLKASLPNPASERMVTWRIR